MHRDLIAHFITTQAIVLSPICPHLAEHVWGLLGQPGSVMDAAWPVVDAVDAKLLREGRYVDFVESDTRKKMDKARSAKKGKAGPVTAGAEGGAPCAGWCWRLHVLVARWC